MLTVLCWKWGGLFTALHVNVLRAALERHLHLDHQLVCVTDDAAGIDPRVHVIPMPHRFRETPRCRRRMQGFASAFLSMRGIRGRVLYSDLDIVIIDDITPLASRPEAIVGWRVGHAGVLSGSFLLTDAGALDGAWQRFVADPEGYPASLQRNGIASDQAMVNDWLQRRGVPVATWTEADGFVTFYGAGYQRLEHLGVGPTRTALPPGARIVVLGSADLHVLDQPAIYPWIDEHWTPLAQACEVSA